MNKSIENYLSELKKAMKDSDPATIQDAVADAHEHFFTALRQLREEESDTPEEEALQMIIEEYGTPHEIAAAYQAAEFYVQPYISPQAKTNDRGLMSRFFGIFGDPAAWGSVLYMVIAILTGTLYFTWAVWGVSLSLVFALFIFGLPFSVLFVLSVKGLGVLEGRIVEGLLGVRMPRRPLFFPREGKWIDRLMLYLKDKTTWLTLLYLLLQLVFGVIYITIWTALLGVGLVLIAMPFIQEIGNLPVITTPTAQIYMDPWMFPLVVIAGTVIITIFMHVAKGIGKLHGRYAKWMLVAD